MRKTLLRCPHLTVKGAVMGWVLFVVISFGEQSLIATDEFKTEAECNKGKAAFVSLMYTDEMRATGWQSFRPVCIEKPKVEPTGLAV